MIDVLLKKHLMTDKDKFRLLFSSARFPLFHVQLQWMYGEDGGNWYRWAATDMMGWLCPALFKYLAIAPQSIFLKVERL